MGSCEWLRDYGHYSKNVLCILPCSFWGYVLPRLLLPEHAEFADVGIG